MKILYTVAIYFYWVIVNIASLFNEKAKHFVTGRRHWEKNLRNKIVKGEKYIWIHCASLGEFEQGRPVIEAIKTDFPAYKIVLTFFSPSGYEIRKNYQQTDVVAYLPIDTHKNACSFINIVQPEKAFFVKYEYWYNYISELKKRGIPLFIFSCIFRKEQKFFSQKPWGKWYRSILSGVEHFFVQNQVSGELLKNIGINNYSITGDTRFDRVATIAAAAKNIPLVEKFRGNSKVIVAGSTWKPDEELLAAFINKSSNLKFIIAPHEVSSVNINRISQSILKPTVLFSKANESDMENSDVIIIDSIGLLSSLYQYGNIAYIGGGFGVGIHNILEAATFGVPVVFGPNYKRFKEAVELAESEGAFSIINFDELNLVFNNLINSVEKLENASSICKKYVAGNVGATQKIIKKVFNN